jgi:hypothetical protein
VTSPVCATCRTRPAAWTATLHDARTGPTGESWPVCDRCKDQAQRLTVLVSHGPLP